MTAVAEAMATKLLFFILFFSSIGAEIVLEDMITLTKIMSIRSDEATFGQTFPDTGLTGVMVAADPLNACHPIKPAPSSAKGERGDHRWFVLIARYGGCNFQQKIERATEANFSAAVVFNINSDRVIPMGGSGDDTIPSVFIGNSDGELILREYLHSVRPYVTFIIFPDDPFDINTYLLPFAIVVGICFLIMLGIVVFKCIQDQRRNRRHRLPKSALKKLPIIKYVEGEYPYDTCCICLEDYDNGDKLRILPCDHAYHKQCIDPWLVKNKRVCPQCRKKVFPGSSSSSRGEDDEEEDDESGTEETAPLLANLRSRAATGGTFAAEGTFAAAVAENQRRRFGSSTQRRARGILSRLRRVASSTTNAAPPSAASALPTASNPIDNLVSSSNDSEDEGESDSGGDSSSNTTTRSSSSEIRRNHNSVLSENHVAIIHSHHIDFETRPPVIVVSQEVVTTSQELQTDDDDHPQVTVLPTTSHGNDQNGNA